MPQLFLLVSERLLQLTAAALVAAMLTRPMPSFSSYVASVQAASWLVGP